MEAGAGFSTREPRYDAKGPMPGPTPNGGSRGQRQWAGEPGNKALLLMGPEGPPSPHLRQKWVSVAYILLIKKGNNQGNSELM